MRRYLKDYIFKSPVIGRTLWNVMRQIEARRDRLAPIRDLDVAGPVAEAPKRILICTSIAGHPTAFRVDSLLAQALSRRGHDVTVLLCDGYLDACQDCEYRWIPSEPHFARHGPARRNCSSCKLRADRGLAGVTYLNYSDLDRTPSPVPDLGADYQAWFALRDGEINLGEHIKAGALRFLARGTIDPDSDFERKVVERYGKAAYKTLSVARTLQSRDFDRVILHHGIYVPQGILCDVLRRSCDNLYTWALGYRSSCILFARGDTYHKVLAGDMPGWDNYELDHIEIGKLEDYLISRGSGANDWVSWNRNSQGLESYPKIEEFFARYKNRCLGLFTNVFWDAQLHFEHSVFENMLEWILATLRWFADRPDLGLVVRIHPAEVTGTVPSRQLLIDEIKARFPDLPPNILVISPQESVNSYDIAAQCRGALIYGTKMGMELAALGKPVITAGDAWVRGKGITLDPLTRESYFSEIDRIASQQVDFDRERARKFAHFYFFKKMIEIKSLRKGSLFAPIELQETDADDGLRLICNAVEQGLDVVN